LIFLFMSMATVVVFFVCPLPSAPEQCSFSLFSEDALYAKKSRWETKLLRALQVYKRFAV